MSRPRHSWKSRISRSHRPFLVISLDSRVLLNVLLSSDTIGIVRKESVFSEEVTENEMDIIQKRVALQQRQVSLCFLRVVF